MSHTEHEVQYRQCMCTDADISLAEASTAMLKTAFGLRFGLQGLMTQIAAADPWSANILACCQQLSMGNSSRGSLMFNNMQGSTESCADPGVRGFISSSD